MLINFLQSSSSWRIFVQNDTFSEAFLENWVYQGDDNVKANNLRVNNAPKNWFSIWININLYCWDKHSLNSALGVNFSLHIQYDKLLREAI